MDIEEYMKIIKDWSNVFSRNLNKLQEDIIQEIEDSDNPKMTIFEIRRDILKQQNINIEFMESKINNYISQKEDSELKNILENVFIEPISKNKVIYFNKCILQNKERTIKLLKLHNENKKLRMMRVINQIL